MFAEPLERRTLLASAMVITTGGTYSGTWESSDPYSPVISVRTTEPVIIENAIVRGPGDLIRSGVDHTNITVRNTQGYGLNPNVQGRHAGEFVEVERFDNLVVEDNYFEHTAGINLLDYRGSHTAAHTARIVDNRARNIDGRRSDGNGGYLNFNRRTSKQSNVTEQGYSIVQFVQLDKVSGVGGMEIAWNEVINEPGNSRVEDNINVYKSGGTPDSPLRIHDNYVQGAYTIAPWQDSYSDTEFDYDWGYAGGGILLGDGLGSTTTPDPAYVQAYDNVVVSTTNHGVAIAAGHDMAFFNNRVISAGVLPDGRAIARQNVGLYIWDLYKGGPSHFYNNVGHDNLVGWVKGTGRNDWWSPVAGALYNNTHLPGPITLETEAAEYALWQQRYAEHQAPPTTPPVAPSDLTAAPAGADRIDLAWTDNSDSESGFRLERSPDGAGDWIEIAALSRNVTTYRDTGLAGATTYHYRVIAINASGDSDASNVASAMTHVPLPPNAPSNLAAVVMAPTRIDLTWTDASTDETGFVLERAVGGSAEWAPVATLPENTTRYSDLGLAPATTYGYRVRATRGSVESLPSNGVTVTTFDAALPAGWASGDVGSTGAAGRANTTGGSAYVVRGAGANIGGSSDAFHFVYRALTGNGTIVARVTGVQNTSSGAKAGIEMRETLSNKARHAGLFLGSTGNVSFVRRTKSGSSSSTTTAAAGAAAPYWLKLARSGNTFTAYRSADGATWTKVGSQTISMGATIYIGLAVSSGKSSVLNASTFDGVSVA